MKIERIYWFRRDLRVEANPALSTCLERHSLLIFILDEKLAYLKATNRYKFMLAGLKRLATKLSGKLLILRGYPEDILTNLAREFNCSHVYSNFDPSPYALARDQRVAKNLIQLGANLHKIGSPYFANFNEPKFQGLSHANFTAFYKRLLPLIEDLPEFCLKTPQLSNAINIGSLPKSVLEKHVDLTSVEMISISSPHQLVEDFKSSKLAHYATNRNYPALSGTSNLSPYLKFGLIHPVQLLDSLRLEKASSEFLRQLIWRDFYAFVLWKYPQTAWNNYSSKLNHIDFCDDKHSTVYQAFINGETGYPLVDAGIRQLLTTGYMHNRLRMLCASFFVKNLLFKWQLGASFFLKHLTDGDIASNNHSWQWAAGCGTDNQPFFRIFNPTLQAQKFDPEGIYIKHWIPELAKLPTSSLFINPVNGWISPVVDYASSRKRALERFSKKR